MANVNYRMSKVRGALNEVEQAPAAAHQLQQQASFGYAEEHATDAGAPMRTRAPMAVDRPAPLRRGFLWMTIDEGQRVLVTRRDGRGQIVVGPNRVLRFGKRFRPLVRHVAHPGEFLIVRSKDGTQEHLRGPVDRWLDPREHKSVETEEVLRLDAKEAVVVYAKDGADDGVARRIVYGPASFVPEPGEWLHSFSWHGSRFSEGRYVKIPGALAFQKLWLMPDQMYHDVLDVRTSDDALLTIRLMVFFELRDIERMLESTHDPIGDFVNAATSDVIDWVGRHDFDGFKRNTEQLNEIATYKQLSARAAQCGYVLHKVVYRGYGATEALQRMHDEAIESRTRLMLERSTEVQSQELEDLKLERDQGRAARRREEEVSRVAHQIEIARRQQEAELQADTARREHQRAQAALEGAAAREAQAARQALEEAHLEKLAGLGVELTRLLTKGAPDQILEVRGNGVPHVHLADPS
ncbi:MAG: hypothetical protein R3F59_09375 [Myxococcota bacterium]